LGAQTWGGKNPRFVLGGGGDNGGGHVKLNLRKAVTRTLGFPKKKTTESRQEKREDGGEKQPKAGQPGKFHRRKEKRRRRRPFRETCERGRGMQGERKIPRTDGGESGHQPGEQNPKRGAKPFMRWEGEASWAKGSGNTLK